MRYLIIDMVLRSLVIWYLLASLICFGMYAVDKSAAISGRRRISEMSLLFLGMLGGWPGAILAQQLLRHKTKKPKFQIVFWLSVVANLSSLYFVSNFLV